MPDQAADWLDAAMPVMLQGVEPESAREPAGEPPPRSSGSPSRLRRAWRWSWQLALLVLLYAGVTAWQERRSPALGSDAPSFVLASLDGAEVTSAELRGQRVLLHFWATWCGVCRLEVSSLNALQHSLPEGARLISVVADAEDVEHVRRFAREHGLDYPVLLADAATMRRFGVGAFPTNYYLDEQGRVRDVTVGMSSRWAMRLRLALLD